MYSLVFPLICLTLAAGEQGFTEPLADEKSPPEFGYKLTKEEAAKGWLALFDGATTFGWKDAKITLGKEPLLYGGTTTSPLPAGTLRLEVYRGGTLTFGGKRHDLRDSTHVELSFEGKSAPLVASPELGLARIDFLPANMQSLFNGKDLADWKQLAYPSGKSTRPPTWRIEKNVIIAQGGPGALEYRPEGKGFLAGDFLLQVDARTRAPHTNGGIFLRNEPGTVMMGYEAQIHHRVYDTRKGEGGCCTGAIDDRQHARRLVARDGEVFRLTALCSGPHIALWVNGQQTADWTDDRPPHENPRRGLRLAPGTLQLQAHDPETDLEFHRVLLQKWE